MIRMPDNVLRFSKNSGTSEDLYIGFADLFSHYRSEVEGKTNLVFDKSKSLDQKEESMNKMLQSEIVKYAGVRTDGIIPSEMLITNPNYRWATFAVVNALIDMIIPDTIIDSVGMYTDVQTGGFGNNFSFDIEPNDLFYVTKSGKGIRTADAQKSFNGQVIVTPIEHDITVQTSLYRVLAGKESLAKFAMKAIRSIETEMAYDAYTAFTTAMGNVPSTSGKELQYTGLSTDNIIDLTEKVTDYNNGAKAIVVGTRKAVSKLLPTNTNYRYELDSDYVKLGYTQTFFGSDVLIMPNKANWQTQYKTMLDDTKLYVVSPSAQKLVKLCIEGNTLANTGDLFGNANLTQETTMKKMWATGVATNAVFGQITIA